MRWLRWLRWTLVVIVVLALIACGAAWWMLEQSLPRLEGRVVTPGIGATVIIERDARGIPVITARSRTDLAFATGYVHGQDRFFQMDLARRLAGGELSELFGKVALEQDIRARRFAFRGVARRVTESAPQAEREVIEAYARGVNAGVTSLGERPWEYLLLQARPR